MKKSEKLKGKAAAENRKKQFTRYVIFGAAAIVILSLIIFYLFNPAVARNGDTVVVYYTGSFENGTVFDSNIGKNPLIFRIGNRTVIPGFEEAVVGMSPNSTKTVHIPVEKAYGSHQESLVHVMNRSVLPKDVEPAIGQMYTITRETDGGVARVLVTNVTAGTVTLDENHLLAGQNLTFTIHLAGFYQK